MFGPQQNILSSENFKQIEDIIDARKLLGQYSINKQSNCTNNRHVYSNTTSAPDSNMIKYEDATILNDGNNFHNVNMKQTDSEITVVRIKCRKSAVNGRQSKWDMHDIAIPGDGCHLGESPSMVNLVTLVGYNVPCEGEEYLVPLSSWEPYMKQEDRFYLKSFSESNIDNPNCSKYFSVCDHDTLNLTECTFNRVEANISDDGIDLVFRRHSWAGKISKFIRKHCKKSKTLDDTCHEN